MSLLRNWNRAALRNASVMTTAAGMPRFSNSMASCTLHNVQDHHPPTSAIAISTCTAIWSIRASVTGYFRFQALPTTYFAWLAAILAGYCLLTTLMKR